MATVAASDETKPAHGETRMSMQRSVGFGKHAANELPAAADGMVSGAVITLAVPQTVPAALAASTRTRPSRVVDELSASERYRQVSLCAYFRAERRGFAPGHMWDDWLAAEREVAARYGEVAGEAPSQPGP
jgi:hypothetical protein